MIWFGWSMYIPPFDGSHVQGIHIERDVDGAMTDECDVLLNHVRCVGRHIRDAQLVDSGDFIGV
jgi:hypothetical protein